MDKENFFGRKIYLETLEKRIRGLKEGYRQNIAIIGDELVGKTSLVFEFLDKFHDNNIIILYLEARPESLNSFTKRFVGTLLYNFLINSNIALKEDLDFLMRKSQKYIPKTAEKAKAILNAADKKNKNNILTDLFSLCEIIYQETDKRCVVILDEFHNLENIGIKSLYREWSKLLIAQKNTMYVITSSLKFKTKETLSKNLSLLFGNFQLICVEPFDIKASEDYLRSRLSQQTLEPGMDNFIVHFSGGYPFYLKVITDAILNPKKQDLVSILENLIFDTSGTLNQKFSNYLKRFLDLPHNQDYLSILHSISCGHNKLKDIAHILHKTKKELFPRINHLLEMDTITRSGDFLKINDPVFGFWLSFVYEGKSYSLTFDAKSQKEIFRANIKNMISEFLLNSERPVIERTAEVLRLFEDDLVQIERKRLRLSRFREIRTLDFTAGRLKEGLIGRSNDSLWIMAFKHDLLTEEDIAEFAKECKKYHHKLQRKIIIALQDVDTNARLKALEEKIWMWDLNNLNQVLDLYAKPRVIV
ncbi:MAG: ATP-binding protein [Candidatus Omnitrophica bacterium]|nr:ATP-binding protein [Candidatus Omnitrophota bacterium]